MLERFNEEIKGRVPVYLDFSQKLEKNQDDDSLKLDMAAKVVLSELHRIWISLRHGLKDSYNDKTELKADVDKFLDDILWVGQFDLQNKVLKDEIINRRINDN